MSAWEVPEPTVRHPDAVWAGQADNALVTAFLDGDVVAWEEYPVRRMRRSPWDVPRGYAGLWQICCIPFYADLDVEGLGAVVATREGAPGVVAEIWETPDRTNFRLEIADAGAIEDVRRACDEAGWPCERGPDRFCVSVEPEAEPDAKEYLDGAVARGGLRWLR